MNRKLILLFVTACFTSFTLTAQPGTWRQVGGAGVWANTLFADAANGTFYTIESSGALYKTHPSTGIYSQIGSQSYANTTMLFAGSKTFSVLKRVAVSTEPTR